MADIDIRHDHALRPEETRALAENIAARVSESFPIEYYWEGESLHFKRVGVSGRIDLEESEVRVRVQLGWLLLPMKQRVEDRIRCYLSETLDA
ncbi:MAG: polyhydroxyalkanoic acid system family protein [Gammaproteobacteria bacterium]